MNDCSELIAELWRDERVQAKLRRRKCRLQEEAGLSVSFNYHPPLLFSSITISLLCSFLDCLPRVTALDYMPSDADILKARLKTVGANEQSFESETNHGGKQTWRFYDIHGCVFFCAYRIWWVTIRFDG